MMKSLLIKFMAMILVCTGFSAAGAETTLNMLLESAQKNKNILIGETLEIDSSLVIPENVTLNFVGDGKLVIAEGAVLTINGSVIANMRPIFSGKGKVNGNANVSYVLPQWFGAVGDGRQNDAGAMQRAADFARTTMSRKLLIPQGTYRIEESITFRCNIDNFGTLYCPLDIEGAQKEIFSSTYLDCYFLRKPLTILFAPDESPVLLDGKSFGNITSGSFKLPNFVEIPLRDQPQKTVTPEVGGTLVFTDSDFFTSRENNKNDGFYTPNDVMKLISTNGDVFPEFCFNYRTDQKEIKPFDAEKSYRKGDYAQIGDQIYKASYISGPGTIYKDRYKGNAEIGSFSPELGESKQLTFPDKSTSGIQLWVKTMRSVAYTPPQAPLTINNLRITTGLINNKEGNKMVYSTLVKNIRSDVVFNRLSIVSIDPKLMLATMFEQENCTSVVVNDSEFSGATFPGLGYNILNSNVANMVYNNCISQNARKGMAGRHGKNITVSGGFYNIIDDHYGMNYHISNVSLNAVSVSVPGYTTPSVDLERWSFQPTFAFVFAGGNILIENCRVSNPSAVFYHRNDVGDLFGNITLKNISVNSEKDYYIFVYQTIPGFDYAHKLLVPSKVFIDQVVNQGGGAGKLVLYNFLKTVVPLVMNNCAPVGDVRLNDVRFHAENNLFYRTTFKIDPQSSLYLNGNIFDGGYIGLSDRLSAISDDNLFLNGATVLKIKK